MMFDLREGLPKTKEVTLLGIGMGDPNNMTIEGVKAAENAEVIIGASRILSVLEAFEKESVNMYKSREIVDFVTGSPKSRFVVALSGDSGFYSGAKKLIDEFDRANIKVSVIPGISTVSYLAARLGVSWDDMKLVSVHGRKQNLVAAVKYNKKVFSLASGAESICEIANQLVEFGLGDVTMTVGSNLSYENESIETLSAAEFTHYNTAGISAVVIINELADDKALIPGISDDAFIRGKVPMTKEEVRVISISKLKLDKDSIVYDVGAGTGSVSIEIARAIPDGWVYAIEKNEEALELIAQNRKKFAAANLEIISGEAPFVLEPIEAPTHAFIGGSGKNLKPIVASLLKKNPKVRIVLNAITLETIAEGLEVIKDLRFAHHDVCCINSSVARELGEYNLMNANNPVYIMTFWND